MRAVNWLIWAPLIVLGTLLVLSGLAVLLGRVAGAYMQAANGFTWKSLNQTDGISHPSGQ